MNKDYSSRLEDISYHISRYFKRAIAEICADDTKHSRTFGHISTLRKLTQVISIYTLKLLMGHGLVTTTEVYFEMNLKRVA